MKVAIIQIIQEIINKRRQKNSCPTQKWLAINEAMK